MIEPLPRLLLGLLTGVLFGILLQKGRVAKFEVVVAQFLLTDWTVAKIMLTAIIVGASGIFALLPFGVVSLHIKPLLLGGVLLGGILFGIGMAVLGYCPGTCVAACGEGRRDAIAGVVGGLVGAGAYVALYPALSGLRTFGDFGKVTLPNATGTSPWLWIFALAAAAILGVWILARRSKA
jgi:hypothetical protein